MPIRIAERALITPEFKEALVSLSIERLKQIRSLMVLKTGTQLACYKKEMAPTIVRLGRIAKDPAGSLDMVITRLRGLPYTRFEVMSLSGEYSQVRFLVGTTKDVEIEHQGMIYNMGPYSVRIPFSKIIGRTRSGGAFQEYGAVEGDTWHFIPLNAPAETDYRHPHHCGIWPVYSKTCWGDFNSMIRNLSDTCDIAELYRTIWIYLNRYNHNSALHGHLGQAYTNQIEFPWPVTRPAPPPAPQPRAARVRR